MYGIKWSKVTTKKKEREFQELINISFWPHLPGKTREGILTLLGMRNEKTDTGLKSGISVNLLQK